MKIFFLILSFFCHTSLIAQDGNESENSSHYVFDSFYPGKVYLKSRQITDQSLNYNSLTKEMIFNSNGKNLAIAEPENVDSVVILSRRFVFVHNKFLEQLTNTKYKLLKEYKSTIKTEGTSIGYGAKTTTSYTHNLKTLVTQGGAYDLKLPQEYEVITKNVYWIKKRDFTYEKFNNAQQLSKILPDEKNKINEFVKKYNTSFSKDKDVVLLIESILQ